MVTALRSEGFHVVPAASASEALGHLRRSGGAPSAVLYDLVAADGPELQLALDTAPHWAAIPQLAFAGVTEHGRRRTLLQAPISFTDVLLQLRRLTGTLQ
jgi:hypothetical protein